MSNFRKIIHIDMDAFFASVEQRDNPDYRGKALVVGSPSERGVVAAASYEARKFGIHSAMSSQRAKQLCPDLIFAKSRMDAYKSVSREINAIFREYTDLIEPLSLDEAFLDVTENKKGIELAQDIALEIKKEIKERLHLTASAGVSYNKFLAKIASDMQKPDGITIIHPQKAEAIIASLPIEAFWGVGKVTAKKMHDLGIHFGVDLRKCEKKMLCKHFGKMGELLSAFARGEDNRSVKPNRERKSVGCERTFRENIKEKSEMLEMLKPIAEELQGRIERANFKGKSFVLKIKRNDFKTFTRSITVEHALVESTVFFELAEKLLATVDFPDHSVRLLGLSVAQPITEKKTKDRKLKKSDTQQLSLVFEDFE